MTCKLNRLNKNKLLQNEIASLTHKLTNLTQEKTSLSDRVAELEKTNDELKTTKEEEERKMGDTIEKLLATNTIYKEKINELIETIALIEKKHKEQAKLAEEKFVKTKKGYDQLLIKQHLTKASKNKQKDTLLSSAFKFPIESPIPQNYEGLKEYYQLLETKLIDTKDMNMKLRNQVLEYKKRLLNRSKSSGYKKVIKL